MSNIQAIEEQKATIKNNQKLYIEITSTEQGFKKNQTGRKSPSKAHKKLMQVRDYMNSILVERETEVDYILAALLSKQSGFLFGVPGTAKSMTIATLAKCFGDMEYFQYLIHQSSTPEDVFGPISIKALKEDKLRYNTTGFLPSSRVAFLDEIFKGNAGLLNGLLTIINEKIFYNGGEIQQSPLESVFCASNEIPEDPSLRALYDRLVFRIKVDPVSQDGMLKVFKLAMGETEIPDAPKLTLADLEEMRAEAKAMKIPNETYLAVQDIDKKIKATFGAELQVSARRYTMILKLMRGFSYLLGHSEVSADTIPILYNCLWDKPEQIEQCRQMLFSSRSSEMSLIFAKYNECLSTYSKYLASFKQYKNDSRSPIQAQMSTDLNTAGLKLNDFILTCFVCAEINPDLNEESKFQDVIRYAYRGIYHCREQRDAVKSGSELVDALPLPTIS